MAVLLAMSAGCTSVVDGLASRTADDAHTGPVPAVGECHDLRDGYDPLQGLWPADCSAPHTAEIVAVGDSRLPADQPYPTKDDLMGTGPVDRAVWDACDEDASDAYIDNTLGVRTWTTDVGVLPDSAAWSAGARWVACAVVYGYGDADPAPGRMAGAMSGPDAAAYRICLDGDPYEHRQVPCARPHTAEPVGWSPRIATGTPFPLDDAARQPLADDCAAAAALYLGGPPPAEVRVDVAIIGDEEGWAQFPLAECVLTQQDASRTTTSLHP